MQVQGDAYTVDEDEALIQELLVRDFGIDEMFEGGSRANEFNPFGGAFRTGRKFVQDGKVKELEFENRRNLV